MNKPSHWSANGTLARARQCGSPNQDSRPEASRIDLLVIHGISLPPGQFRGTAIEKLFTNRLNPRAHDSFAALQNLRVSSHFLIRRGGALVQFVPCDMRAWHAGVSEWAGRTRCNDFSIGVELEGTDELAYTAPQYRELARLTSEILDRYPIADIVGHSHIAPGRKTDPGPIFDWAGYRLLLQSRRHHGAFPAFPGFPASK